MSSIQAAKSALRKSTLQSIKSLTDQEVQQQCEAEAVWRHVLASPFYQNAQRIGCYISMSTGELRTDGIVDDILTSGKKLFTPYLPPSTSSEVPTAPEVITAPVRADMQMLRVYSQEDLKNCPLDKWGLLDPGAKRREPGKEEEEREDVLAEDSAPLDLIIIPGVAFDTKCNRLGRGKAFYDRFFLNYTSARPAPLLVGLGLTPQILPKGQEVPNTNTDFQLDGVISSDGIVWREGALSDKVVKQ